MMRRVCEREGGAPAWDHRQYTYIHHGSLNRCSPLGVGNGKYGTKCASNLDQDIHHAYFAT